MSEVYVSTFHGKNQFEENCQITANEIKRGRLQFHPNGSYLITFKNTQTREQ